MVAIDSLVAQLRSIIISPTFKPISKRAVEQNLWFTPGNIERAVEAIAAEMLDVEKVEQWLNHYDMPSDMPQRRVGIVMAGNIPMAGFFDLFCVLITGHIPVVKPSSKDRVLMDYIARQMGVEIVDDIMDVELDMLIATGSSQTARLYASTFAKIPTITRGERHSIAILNGTETQEQLRALLDDMFLYWGLGCRNVNHLYLPRGFDLKRIPNFETTFQPFIDNYRYNRTLYSMQQKEFTDKSNYLMIQTDLNTNFTPPIGIIRYSFYDKIDDIQLDSSKIQCIVTTNLPNGIVFGQSQKPQLADYPDDCDVIRFLIENR